MSFLYKPEAVGAVTSNGGFISPPPVFSGIQEVKMIEYCENCIYYQEDIHYRELRCTNEDGDNYLLRTECTDWCEDWEER